MTKETEILIALREKAMSRAELLATVKVTPAELRYALEELRNKEYVFFENAYNRRLWTITNEGIRHIRYKPRGGGQVAQPNRINIFALPVYQSPKVFHRGMT